MTNPFFSVINSLLPEPQASLLNGILFGIKGTMPKEFNQALIDTGTLHIIALSGMNISILSGLFSRVTLFLGRKTSSLISIGAIILFILFVGPSPSVVRAGIMGGFSMMAVYVGRPYWVMLSLVLSAVAMVLLDRSMVSNLSFQLSVLATLGIILSQKFAGKRKKPKGVMGEIFADVKENFRMTIFAQVFTAPVILINFSRFSLIAPVANVAIGWVIQPLMILGVAVSIMGWVWRPLAVIPAWFLWLPLTYIIEVVELLAKIPFASLEF